MLEKTNRPDPIIEMALDWVIDIPKSSPSAVVTHLKSRHPHLMHQSVSDILEKIPTTPVMWMKAWGVKIESRYRCESEFRRMLSIIADLPVGFAENVDEFFCDSKACAYTVTLRPCDPAVEKKLVDRLSGYCSPGEPFFVNDHTGKEIFAAWS